MFKLSSVLANSWRWLLLAFLMANVTACSSDPEEGGVIGTGIIIKGTVSDQKQLANSILEIRSQSGDRFEVAIAQDGQYFTAPLNEQGPWLLRSNLGNGIYQYGIGYPSVVSHVHSYVDVVTRAWFLDQYDILDINEIFDSENPLPALPTIDEFTIFSAPYTRSVEYVLNLYDLNYEDLFRIAFRNDDVGVDAFLSANPVVLEGTSAGIVIVDPDTSVQNFYRFDLLLNGFNTIPDNTPPSIPENLRAFGNASAEIELIWDTATDDTVVMVYDIFRDGVFVGFTPSTTFTDSDVQPGTAYTYEVKAVDLRENSSIAAVTTAISTPAIDTGPPSTPRQLTNILATTRQIELAWVQDNLADVYRFNVYRGTAPDNLELLVQTTSPKLLDAGVSSGTDYWYAVSAVNVSGNESPRSQALQIKTTGVIIGP